MSKFVIRTSINEGNALFYFYSLRFREARFPVISSSNNFEINIFVSYLKYVINCLRNNCDTARFRDCTWHKYRRTKLAVRIPNGHVPTYMHATLCEFRNGSQRGGKKSFGQIEFRGWLRYIVCPGNLRLVGTVPAVFNSRRIFVRGGRLCRRIIICNYCCTRLAHTRSWTVKSNCVSRHLILLFSFLIAATLCYLLMLGEYVYFIRSPITQSKKFLLLQNRVVVIITKISRFLREKLKIYQFTFLPFFILFVHAITLLLHFIFYTFYTVIPNHFSYILSLVIWCICRPCILLQHIRLYNA